MQPLSGDPVALTHSADEQLAVAAAIEDAARRLTAISKGEIAVSEAVDAVGKKAGEVASLITKAHVRLHGTAEAVLEYAKHLEHAQSRANAAIAASHDALDAKSHAESRKNDVDEQSKTDPDPDLLTKALKFAHELEQHASEEAAALLEYGKAVAEKEAAALVAIGKINAAADASGLSDSLFDYLAKGWDDFMQWVRDNAETLAFVEDLLETISSWAGFLSTILSLLALLPIPGLDAVLAVAATALRVISIVTGAVALLITVLLVISGSGKKSVGELIGQGIGFAAQFIPVPGAKGAAEGVTSTVAATAGRAAGRRAGDLVEIGIDAGKDFVTEYVASAAEAVTNVSNPDAASTCPADPPSPIRITGLPQPDEYGMFDPPSLLSPAIPVSVNPEWIATIGCKAAA